MKRILLSVFFILVCSPSIAAECPVMDAVVGKGVAKGKDLLLVDEKGRGLYMMGFMNGITLAPFLGASDECMALVEHCQRGKSALQLGTALIKFLRRHPEHLETNGNVVTFLSMVEMCGPSRP